MLENNAGMSKKKDVLDSYFNESLMNCAHIFTLYYHDTKNLKIRLEIREIGFYRDCLNGNCIK